MPRICPRCGAIATDSDKFCHMDGTPLEEHPVTPHQEAAAARSQQPTAEPVSREAYLGRTLLGQFHLFEVCGAGSMGTVYKARQMEIDRIVAVKILHPELANQPEAVLRFHREAKVVSTLSHPNIVHIYLFGHLPDGNLYIVQEFVDGRNLASDISGGPMGLRKSLHVADQMLSAISEAHGHGVIHRDLKPENIMLTMVGEDSNFVKILDFGVAKRITTQTFATKEGLIFGSPRYISPEAAAGDKIDQRSDLYSLGVVLYQMLCGEPPFVSKRPVQLLLDHVNTPPPPLRGHPGAADVPQGVEGIVMKLLAKRPEHRYPTATAVREALIDAVRASGGSAASYLAGSVMPPAAVGQPLRGGVQDQPPAPAPSVRAAPPSREQVPAMDSPRWGPGAGDPVRVPTAQASIAFGRQPDAARPAPGYGEVVSDSEMGSDDAVLSTEAMYSMAHRRRVRNLVLLTIGGLILIPLLVVGFWFGYNALSKRLFTYDEVARTGDIASDADSEVPPADAPPGIGARLQMDVIEPVAGAEVKFRCDLSGFGGDQPKAWFVVRDVAGGETRIPAKQVQVVGDGSAGRVLTATYTFEASGTYTLSFIAGEDEVGSTIRVEVSDSGSQAADKGKGKKKKEGGGADVGPVDVPHVEVPPPEIAPKPDAGSGGGPIKIIKIEPGADTPEKKKSSWY
mgnify:CR=1 FL=1